MSLSSQDTVVPCTTLSKYQEQTVTTTTTYQDKCTNTNDGTVYFNSPSTNVGAGQCVSYASNPPCGGKGQPACITTVLSCAAVVEAQETQATSPSDYNRFYNRAYGQTIGFNGSGSYICNGKGSGTFTQNFQECQGVACNGNGNGGGQCQPTMPPPYNPPCGDTWNTQSCCWQPQQCGSPILIDTLGKGFELTSAEEGVKFDISGSGHPVQIAWTTPNSRVALLALDRNGNGKIDGGQELFGNFTPQPPSAEPNGFLALAEFDKPENGGNGDGIIDSRDAVFSRLELWVDENHDGISQPNELHSLPELGVFSLSLKYGESRRTDEFGNRCRYKSTVNPNPNDGESKDGRWSYDVFFLELSEFAQPTAAVSGTLR